MINNFQWFRLLEKILIYRIDKTVRLIRSDVFFTNLKPIKIDSLA